MVVTVQKGDEERALSHIRGLHYIYMRLKMGEKLTQLAFYSEIGTHLFIFCFLSYQTVFF